MYTDRMTPEFKLSGEELFSNEDIARFDEALAKVEAKKQHSQIRDYEMREGSFKKEGDEELYLATK